jgi:uncharacterized repeat protein (TIGR01451 family)
VYLGAYHLLSTGRRTARLARLTALTAAIALAVPGAAMTPAGTTIRNIAQIAYDLDGKAAALDSNAVDLRVDELIELAVEPAPACAGQTATDGKTVIGFRLTNRGNGREAFIPEAPTVEGGDFVPEALVADSNRDGCYDPAVDAVIPVGGKTPELAPGDSIVLFVVGTYHQTVGTVRVRVKSSTGVGTTGTVIGGAGDDGSDAVMGVAGGTVEGEPGTPEKREAPLVASLVKSQSVRAPDGSERALRGAIITYRIEGRFTGNGVATDVAIADPIPAGTAYVPGSLTLDDGALSDGADRDAGAFDGNAIAVKLGGVVAPAVRTVSFQVRIQ